MCTDYKAQGTYPKERGEHRLDALQEPLDEVHEEEEKLVANRHGIGGSLLIGRFGLHKSFFTAYVLSHGACDFNHLYIQSHTGVRWSAEQTWSFP